MNRTSNNRWATPNGDYVTSRKKNVATLSSEATLGFLHVLSPSKGCRHVLSCNAPQTWELTRRRAKMHLAAALCLDNIIASSNQKARLDGGCYDDGRPTRERRLIPRLIIVSMSTCIFPESLNPSRVDSFIFIDVPSSGAIKNGSFR